MEIKAIVGALSGTMLDDSKNLIEGTVVRNKGEEILQQYKVDGNKGSYKLYSTGNLIYPTDVGKEITWQLRLSPNVELDLQSTLVVGDLNLDLSDLQISELNVELVIGESRVILPEKGQFSARIEGVIGQMTIIVPPGMNIRIESDLGLANLSTPPGYEERGDVIFSPGYESAQNRINLHLSQVIGSVAVIQK
jgi:hypothetical protein